VHLLVRQNPNLSTPVSTGGPEPTWPGERWFPTFGEELDVTDDASRRRCADDISYSIENLVISSYFVKHSILKLKNPLRVKVSMEIRVRWNSIARKTSNVYLNNTVMIGVP